MYSRYACYAAVSESTVADTTSQDIGIATYLMLLWKQSFTGTEQRSGDHTSGHDAPWPQPPGGFLDLG